MVLNQEALIFFPEPFEIAEKDKLTVYRFNEEDETPFCHINKTSWDNKAKAVRMNTFLGVYGFTKEQIDYGTCTFFFNIFQDSAMLRRPYNFVKLEVDKNKVFYRDEREIVFTEANIIGVMTYDELKKEFPQYNRLFDLYKTLHHDFKFLDKDGGEDVRIELEQSVGRERGTENGFKPVNHNEPVHGLGHSYRVEKNGYMLSQFMNVSGTVVRIFSYLHDFCRLNDGTDPEHGLRAANHVESIREFIKYHLNANDREVDLIAYACKNHTDMVKSDIEIVNICFDADRLDLGRCGITLDPKLMATTLGGMYAVAMNKF
jgi:uncharacterized protein